jgi:hypothetical protein
LNIIERSILADGRILRTAGDPDQLQSLSYHLRTKGKAPGEVQVVISFAEGLSTFQKKQLLSHEIEHLRQGGNSDDVAFLDTMSETIKALAVDRKEADVSISSVIIPERKTKEGLLVKSTSYVWEEIVQEIGSDWGRGARCVERNNNDDNRISAKDRQGRLHCTIPSVPAGTHGWSRVAGVAQRSAG